MSLHILIDMNLSPDWIPLLQAEASQQGEPGSTPLIDMTNGERAIPMMNKERFESLRSLTPIEAVEAWLEGRFGFGDEPALIEAIRRDPQVNLSGEQITDGICDAMDEGSNARECLENLRKSEPNET